MTVKKNEEGVYRRGANTLPVKNRDWEPGFKNLFRLKFETGSYFLKSI